MSSSEEVSSPEVASESRGSSVSTALREEYEDLLRYAVVAPVLNTSVGGGGLTGTSAKKPQGFTRSTSGVPPPRSSPPPRPHTPPRHATRNELKVKVSKVESVDSSSELSCGAPQTSTPPQPTLIATPPPLPQSLEVDPLSSNVPSEVDSVNPLISAPEVARLESQLDTWCSDLKQNVLVEFDQAKVLMMERHHLELMKERQRHAHEIEQLREELERYKELLVTYEQAVDRKDHIISNLTRAFQKQKDHVELQHTFSSWKLRHVNNKRESFTSTLARRHSDRQIMSRVWAAWFGIVKGRWKQKVEKACQIKAEEVCVQLTSQYEEQLASVHKSLESCQEEVARLKAEKNLYEENMKKAFMRGVCALNMEAMTMFQHHKDESVDQRHSHTCASESQLASVPPHSQAGSKPDMLLSSSRHVPNSHMSACNIQSRSGSKPADITIAETGSGIQPSIPKLGQTSAAYSKNNFQRKTRFVPVVVEKH